MSGGERVLRRRKGLNKSRVWCGVMKRIGSGQHMYRCRDCHARRRAYWAGFGVPVVWGYGAAIKAKWRVRQAKR